MSMSDGGKGSDSRPMEVTRQQFASNWDLIFGKKSAKNTNTQEADGDSSEKPKPNEQTES